MKMDYYEAFDLIAEEAVDLLAEYQSDDSFLNKFSVEDTLNAMQKKVVKKKVPMKIRFLMAAVLVIIVSVISFAGEEGSKGQLITDENRHLVGKNGMGEASVFDKDGNLVSGVMPKEPPGDEIWETSTVIRRTKNAFPPLSIAEITVQKEGDAYITPEIIFWNGDMVIWTKEDGSGWRLKKGQTLSFDVELYPNETPWRNGQCVGFYEIRNGVFHGDVTAEESNVHHYEITAKRRGEYYIAFVNGSSDSISFKEGVIKIQ